MSSGQNRLAGGFVRRLLRHVVRWTVLFGSLLAAAYVTVPWWLPTDFVRRHLQQRLSDQMGVPVTVDSLTVSWSGVEVRGLSVAASPSFGGGTMARVNRLAAELAPLKLLLNHPLDWMQIDGARLDVRLDAEGNVNLQPLLKADTGPQPRLTSIRDAVITVRGTERAEDSGTPDALVFRIGDAQIEGGKIERIERVTVSAELAQGQTEVPIALNVGTGGKGSALASVVFSFARLRLEGLDLPRRLGLPLSKLAGLCRGSLSLHLSRDYVIDNFCIDVGVDNLDAQPRQGPVLPVIGQAQLLLAGQFRPSMDQPVGELRITTLKAVLPGLELSGTAGIVLDTETGQMRTLQSLGLSGRLTPQPLWALLGGGELPGGVVLSDAVIIDRLNVEHRGEALSLDAGFSATQSEVSAPSGAHKAAGVPLEGELTAAYDERRGTFTVDRVRARIGPNSFEGSGSALELSRLAQRWSTAQSASELQGVLAELRNARWSGACTVADLGVLADLLPDEGPLAPVRRGLEAARLAGELRGRLSLTNDGATRVGFELSAGPGSELTLGALAKRADQPLAIRGEAQVDAGSLGLRGVELSLTAGQGQARLDNAQVRLGVAGTPAEMTFDSNGHFQVDGLDVLLPSRDAKELGIVGSLGGQWAFQYEPGAQRVNVLADLTRVGLHGRMLAKPPGQPLTVSLNVLAERAGGSPVVRAVLEAESPHASLSAQAVYAAPVGGKSLKGGAHLHISDARWIGRWCPALAKTMAPGELRGSMDAWADLTLAPQSSDLDLRVDADDVQYESASPRRTKPAGMPMRLRLAAHLQRQADELIVTLPVLALDLGASSLRLDGGLMLSGESRVLPAIIGPGQGKAGFTATIVPDEQLCGLSPEIAAVVDDCGLSGALKLKGRLGITDEGVVVDCGLDATHLGAKWIGPLELSSGGTSRPLSLGPFAKPKDTPAQGDVQLVLQPDLRRVRLTGLKFVMGDCGLLGGGTYEWSADDQGVPAKLSAHVALWSKDLGQLAKFAPGVSNLDLSGEAMVEFELTHDGRLSLPYATFNSRGLAMELAGKPVRLAGELTVQDVSFPDRPGAVRIGRARTDALEFAIGSNGGWLRADVADPLSAPRGMLSDGLGLHVIADQLDDRDLATWLAGPGESPPADQELSPERRKQVRRDAARLLEAARPYLQATQCAARVQINCFKTFDPQVQQPYELRWADVRASVRSGLADLSIAGVLNGGSYVKRADVDVRLSRPVLHCSADASGVRASSELQAQIAKVFPGNTLYGELTQHEGRQVDLIDALAESIDPRCVAAASGTAKTVAQNGLLEGRAAPRFVTTVFPGLNLAKYHYSKMTGFADYQADGSVVNDMIFDGSGYNIYIHGSTAADGRAEYELGLLLLPLSHEASHQNQLSGRLPVFRTKARIVGGKMQDQEIYYTYRTVTEVLLAPAYTAYLAWRAAQGK